MELVQGFAPLFLHTAQNDTALGLTFCGYCRPMLLIDNIPKVLYFDLQLIEEENQNPVAQVVAAVSNSETSCQLIQFQVAIDMTTSTTSIIDRKVLLNSSEPFRIDQSTALPISGLNNPVLANGSLAYWDVTHHKLLLQNPQISSPIVIADNSTGTFKTPGAWARMVAIPDTDILVVTFFDLEQHSLFVNRCRVVPTGHNCDTPRVVDTEALQGDFTDWGAGAFPDLQLNPHHCPVLAYFVQTPSNTSGCVRILQCHDPFCQGFRVFDATCGLSGYGRDASVTFPMPGSVIVSFLDLQGRDDPIFMQARAAVFENEEKVVGGIAT
jgi:hypothetical protein